MSDDEKAAERKRIADDLRGIADQIESGRVDMYCMAYRGRCEKPTCETGHIGLAIQSTVSTDETEIWLVGAANVLADYTVRDYHQRMARASMAPFVEALQRAHATREAEGATKQ